MRKRIICLLLTVILVALLSSCQHAVTFSVKKYNGEVVQNPGTDGVIAENDRYRLDWLTNTCAVDLTDKVTGQKWGITPTKKGEKTVDEFGMPIKKNPKLSSALIIEYTNEFNTLETEISYLGAVKNGKVNTEKIENGIKVEYYFDSVEIMVPVEYELRGDSVAITVDPAKIQENDKKLTAVSVAPYWCCTENNSQDAYLFVPSGSGALVTAEERSQSGALYSSQVYGRDWDMTTEDAPITEKAVRLPVYGAKQGDRATCAIIENGADSCKISVVAGSSTVGYGAVYATYQLRGYNEGAELVYSAKQDVYSDTMTSVPMTVGFYPLSGEDADYSGMARVYRDYLKKNGKLKATETEIPLGVTVVGGTMVDRSVLGVPSKELLLATTLNETEKILRDIKVKTDAKISAKLIGFGKTGLTLSKYAGGMGFGKNLGSKDDWKKLNRYAKKNGVDLYPDFDLIRFKKASSGFSTAFDTAQNTRFQVTDLYEYNVATRSRIPETNHYLLARKHLKKGAQKFLSGVKNLNLDGVSLETLSGISYSDYSDRNSNQYTSKAAMENDVTAILKKVKEKYKFAATDANAYAALVSDVIFDAPSRSSGESIFSRDVPFYQMVFKGHIPMTSEPINLSADAQAAKLWCAETGCGLNYVVTSKYDNELSNANTYYFFGSQYADLKDSLVAAQQALSTYQKAVAGAEILKNGVLDNGLHFTKFSNGIRVFVNVSSAAVDSPLGSVKPNDFVWGKVE